MPSANLNRRPISLLVAPSETASMIWRSRIVRGSGARCFRFPIFLMSSSIGTSLIAQTPKQRRLVTLGLFASWVLDLDGDPQWGLPTLGLH